MGVDNGLVKIAVRTDFMFEMYAFTSSSEFKRLFNIQAHTMQLRLYKWICDRWNWVNQSGVIRKQIADSFEFSAFFVVVVVYIVVGQIRWRWQCRESCSYAFCSTSAIPLAISFQFILAVVCVSVCVKAYLIALALCLVFSKNKHTK